MKNKSKYNPVEILLILMLLLYPLIFTRLYSNISNTKYITFMLFAITIYYAYIMKLAFKNIEVNKSFKPSIKKAWLNFSLVDYAMLLFLLANFVSVLLSDYKIEAFTGSCSKNMGLIYNVALVMIYFAIRGGCSISKGIFYALGSSYIIMILFSTVQFMGFDLFGFIAKLTSTDTINYLSLLGNTNVYSSYLCLVSPVFMVGAVLSKKQGNRIFCYILSTFGFIGLFTANSDSGYIGYFTAFILILFIATGYKERLIRYLYLCLLYLISTSIFFIIYSNFKSQARPLSDITRIMCYGSITKILILVFVLLIFILHKINFNENAIKITRRVIRILLGAFIVSAVFILIYLNIIDHNASLGKLDVYLKFSDSWGTDRGYVWKWSINIFKDGNLLRKIFGYGPGTCGIELLLNYGDIMKYDLGYYFTNSHNEYLEILINIGILGLASYIVAIVLTVVKNFKRKNSLKLCFSIAIIAYCMQSFFIIMQPIVNPLVFIFLGLANAKSASDKYFDI